MHIGVVVGNPKPRSRTCALATRLAQKIDDTAEIRVVDLADYKSTLFDWPAQELGALAETVASQDLLIVASPTYKGSYTGLLKAFLDRYPSRALAGVMAVPVMTMASEAHSMAAEVHLRPLLMELGVITPTAPLVFLTPQEDQRELLLDEWMTLNATGLKAIRQISRSSPGGRGGGLDRGA